MKASYRALVLLWMIGGTWTLAQLWLTHPDALPHFPRSFAEWITRLWTERGLDRFLDVETVLVYLICAAVTGSIAGALVRLLGLKR